MTSTDPVKTETRFLIISKMILHHLEISKLNTQLFLLMSSPLRYEHTHTHTHALTHTQTCIRMCAVIHTCVCRKAYMRTDTHRQKRARKAEHALTQTHTHFPQMDRCCTSRGTETQQLFPSQSDGLPLIVHEYFTLSQNGCIPDRLQLQPHWAR